MSISIPTTNRCLLPFGIIAGVINPSDFATPSPTNIHCGTAEQILAQVRANKNAETTRLNHPIPEYMMTGKAFTPVTAIKAIANLLDKERPRQIERILSVIARTDMTSPPTP